MLFLLSSSQTFVLFFLVELSQMKLKMQRKDLELKLSQSKKLNELVQSKLEMQKRTLEDSKRAEQSILGERKQLAEEVREIETANCASQPLIFPLSTFQQIKQLKIREERLREENENLKSYLRKATN